MTNPFHFDVSGLTAPATHPTATTRSGPCPVRIGNAMIAIEKGQDTTVEATITPLGQSVMIQANVFTTLNGQCSRCLSPITADYSFTIDDVFVEDLSVIATVDEHGDDDDDPLEAEDVSLIVDDAIDITQDVIDTVGLDIPFSPVCADYGLECDDEETQLIAGVVDSDGGQAPKLPDIRWAGLEKFK